MSARARGVSAKVAALAALAVLAGCGGEEHRELQAELRELTKDVRGRVDPLPQVKPYEPVPYTAEGMTDKKPGRHALRLHMPDGGQEIAGRAFKSLSRAGPRQPSAQFQ